MCFICAKITYIINLVVLAYISTKDNTTKDDMSGFSTKESVSLEKTVDVSDSVKSILKDEIETYYELDRCVKWIKEKNAQRICLQFPDDLLGDSVEIVLNLKKCIDGLVYILGDTSYGSCCVDEVAAQHVNADVIIHFGKACLSPTSRLPVLYIFEKCELDVCDFVSSFQTIFTHESKVLVLYEVCYSHLIGSIQENLTLQYENVVISKLAMPNDDTVMNESKSMKILGREITLAENSDLQDYQIVFIGKDGRTLTNFFMYMGGGRFYVYDSSSGLRPYEYQGSRFLMRRMYLVERVRDAQTLGVLVGTLGVADYLGAVDGVKRLARRHRKRSYIVAVGKPNVAKLANFPEIEVFVLIACPENCLLDSKEFYRPIVTPYEVELALNPKQELGQTYVADFRELLPGGRYHVGSEDGEASVGDGPTDVSLVTGRLRSLRAEEGEGGSEESSTTTVAERGDASLATVGDPLLSRSWRGLEQRLGQTEVATAERGRSGMPARYDSELGAGSR